MFDFEKMCRKYEVLSFEELRDIAANESKIFLPALDALEGDGLDTFFLFVATACGADGKLDPEEYRLFTELTGIDLTYEDAEDMVEEARGEDSQNVMDYIVDLFGVLDEDIKYSMVIFCLAFCAANGKIDWQERRFIRKLLKE